MNCEMIVLFLYIHLHEVIIKYFFGRPLIEVGKIILYSRVAKCRKLLRFFSHISKHEIGLNFFSPIKTHKTVTQGCLITYSGN